MKLMAIDYGRKRVGIASTDETGGFALPREVWANDNELVNKIVNFARVNEIKTIVLGESKNFVQQNNPIAEAAGKLKLELEAAGFEVVLHPEIYTTLEARRLQGNNDMTDASAAALILKSYIESAPTRNRT